MTPKEKAQELVDKFKPYMYPFGSGSAFLTGDRSDNQVLPDARKCAIMCIDEILNYTGDIITGYKYMKTSDKSYQTQGQRTEYWQEVKNQVPHSI